MKKMISVVVTVIMLLSVCGLQSFAFTVKLPTVTSVKFIDEPLVSMKEMDNSDKLIKEYIEYIEKEHGVSFSDIEDLAGDIMDELYKFYLEDGTVELTLSDGSVVEMKLEDGFYEIDGYTDIQVDAYVEYEDYLALKESGADSVEIVVDCEVYSHISGIGKKSSFNFDADVVACFVKSFKPVSTINYALYEDSDVVDLEGKKFSVTYADGTKKTLTAKFDTEEGEYRLGDEYIYSLLFDGKVELAYMDELYEHSVTFNKANPYKSIKITDYEFSQTEGLTSVSYKITDKNGNSKSFTSEIPIDPKESLYPSWELLGVYDSYYICIESEDKINWDTNETTGVEAYLELGDLYSESIGLDYYEVEDNRTVLEKIEEIIATILSTFFSLLSFFE